MTNKEKEKVLARVNEIHEATEPAESQIRKIVSVLRLLVNEIETTDS
ncbi:MAG TPA: hypothetical protein VNZ45_01530 [Bacteroidia bacterium]|jgi:hypothetical protein|nr:hypothetical protein [Bacteroidia bacterium]